MIRRLILRPPRPILLLALAMMVMPNPAARAQDRGIQDRLDRLERDLSMLQRQVYRGGPSPVVSPGSGGAVDAASKQPSAIACSMLSVNFGQPLARALSPPDARSSAK